jgi:hypothetical protein
LDESDRENLNKRVSSKEEVSKWLVEVIKEAPKNIHDRDVLALRHIAKSSVAFEEESSDTTPQVSHGDVVFDEVQEERVSKEEVFVELEDENPNQYEEEEQIIKSSKDKEGRAEKFSHRFINLISSFVGDDMWDTKEKIGSNSPKATKRVKKNSGKDKTNTKQEDIMKFFSLYKYK